MKVVVKLFAGARELMGQEQVIVELPTNATIGQLRACLLDECAELRGLLPYALFATDATYINDDDTLPPSGEIACIPPVSGG